nr:hypothetical protein [Tanacetum cinerariifolium]
MKIVFKNLEAEVDQNAIDLKSGEIESKNLLITNENFIANCVAQDVFFTVTDSAMTASRFHELFTTYIVAMNRAVKLKAENSKLLENIKNDDHDTMVKAFSKLEVAHLNLQLKHQHFKENIENFKSKSSKDVPEFDAFFKLALQERLQNFKAENEKVKLHYQDLFNFTKITRIQTIDKTTSLQNEIKNLKTQLKGKMPYVTSNDATPKVPACAKYAIDVQPIPPCQRNNRVVHHGYLNHLRDTLDILHEIVKEARNSRNRRGYCEGPEEIGVFSKATAIEKIGFLCEFCTSRPAPNLLTHGPISSRFVPNRAPAILYVPHTKKELEILFQPMFDEYFEPSTIDQQVPPAHAVHIPVNPPCPSVSISVDQDAPSEGHPSSSSDHQSSFVHNGVAADNSLEVNPFAPADNEPFVNISAPNPSSKVSSSREILIAESNQSTQPHEHLRK